MQQFVWKTLQSTGVTDAAKAATESLVSMAARQLTEAATSELERRWTNAARSTNSRSGRRSADTRRASYQSKGLLGASRSPSAEAAGDRKQESLRRLRETVSTLEATIDTLASR